MVGRETVNRMNGLLVLVIMMLGILRPAAMQETVANPAKARFEIASITPNTSGKAGTGGNERFTTASGSVLQNDRAESTQAEDERQVREALAEYFAILQEWSRDSRSQGARSDSGI